MATRDTSADPEDTVRTTLEVGTVLALSEALSGEPTLDAAIHRVLVVAMDRTGVERALLLLADRPDLETAARPAPLGVDAPRRAEAPFRVVAEATTTHASDVHVTLRPPREGGEEVPASIVQYAARTHARVVVGDLSVSDAAVPYATDRYFEVRSVRSLLCLPLVKRGILVGILYLENERASYASTPARSAILDLLASFAAVALDDARSHADLQKAQDAAHRLHERLAQVTRGATLDELIASIAHEVSQPLAAVTASANAGRRWLDRSPPDVERALESLERVLRDSDRANRVIAQLRALFRKTNATKQSLDLAEVVREVVGLVRSDVQEEQIVVSVDVDVALAPVVADRVQLQQVSLNLMINGIQAMAETPEGSRRLLVRARPEGPHHVVVSVCDSGPGLSADARARLFEAFHTTKPASMGMGLSIGRSIVREHGGRIWAEPSADTGAVFCFTLATSAEFAEPVDDPSIFAS